MSTFKVNRSIFQANSSLSSYTKLVIDRHQPVIRKAHEIWFRWSWQTVRIVYVVRFISIFNQTAFCSEVLRGMVDTPFCRICHFCSISKMGGHRFHIFWGLMGVNRWVVVCVTIGRSFGVLKCEGEIIPMSLTIDYHIIASSQQDMTSLNTNSFVRRFSVNSFWGS